MSPKTRLWVLFVLIVLSAGYAVLIKKDPSTASALALIYVAFLLTVIVINHTWRRS